MSAAILSIGTELLRGEITNTNCSWLCEEITGLGMAVTESVVVGDSTADISATLARLAKTHRLVVSTGGLGPTTDDLTTRAVAELMGVDLRRDAKSLQRIETRMRAVGRSIAESNAKQADFPVGASILANDFGTAPGFAVDLGDCRAAFLPGVPREMKGMFSQHIEPWVKGRVTQHMYQSRLRTFGAPESAVNDQLAGIEEEFDVVLGYRAHFPEIEVKALAYRDNATEAKRASQSAATEIRRRLGALVYGEGERGLPQVVGDALSARGYRLGLAESCTGGLLAELFTQNPASHFFAGAIVSYENAVKQQVLGVSEHTLAVHGAVSEPVVREMAAGARRVLNCDVSIALSGIAGPSGGTEEKPVGLVHYAVATPSEVIAKHRVFPGGRERVQLRAAYAALDELRRLLSAAR